MAVGQTSRFPRSRAVKSEVCSLPVVGVRKATAHWVCPPFIVELGGDVIQLLHGVSGRKLKFENQL